MKKSMNSSKIRYMKRHIQQVNPSNLLKVAIIRNFSNQNKYSIEATRITKEKLVLLTTKLRIIRDQYQVLLRIQRDKDKIVRGNKIMMIIMNIIKNMVMFRCSRLRTFSNNFKDLFRTNSPKLK